MKYERKTAPLRPWRTQRCPVAHDRRRRFFLQGLICSLTVAAASPATAASNRTQIRFMCWEGYNYPTMYADFEAKNNATISFDVIADSPAGFARLLAGGTEDIELIASDSPWIQQMGPAGLCEFINPADFKAVIDDVYPAFRAPFAPLLYDGKVTGLPTRWAWIGPAINLDLTREKEWRYYDGCFDPANRGKIGVMDWGDWPIMPLALHAGINPYRELDHHEFAEVRKVIRALFRLEPHFFTDISLSQKALIDGSVKALVGTGLYHTGALRRLGYNNIRAIVPESRHGLKQSIIAVEAASIVKSPRHPQLIHKLLRYLLSTKVLYQLSWTNFTVAPVAYRHVEYLYNDVQKNALQFEDYQEALEKSVIHDVIPNINELLTIWQEEMARVL